MNNNKKDMMSQVKLVLHTLSYFYKDAISYKPFYFVIIIFSILVNALSPFINIILPKYIIDELLGERRLTYLAFIVIVTIISNFICNAIKDIIRETLGKYSDSFERYFKIKMSYKTMDMDYEQTEDPTALEQISKAKTGMDWYSGGINGLTYCFVSIVSSIITLCGVIYLLATGSIAILFISIITVIFRSIITSKINAINVKYFKKLVAINRGFGYIYWELSNFRFGKDVRLYGSTDMMLHKADSYNTSMTSKWKEQSRETLTLSELDVCINAISTSLCYLYLGFLMIGKSITIGDFYMLSNAGSTFGESLRNIIWNVQEIHKKSTFMEEYITFMDYQSNLVKGNRDVPRTGTYEFKLVNVGFKYPRQEEFVFRNVNLTLSNNEHLSIVGLNGAGKTTFVKLLCRLYDVTEGEILLNGINIKEFDYDQYMNLFSVVFQDFRLFAFSIKDNIMVNSSLEKLDNKDLDELQSLYGLCGLEEKINSLKDGANTLLYKEFSDEGIEPSGGEAQKIAIARALYKNAPIVILDEPTAALDPVAEYEIYNHFDNLVGGKMALYISHRLSSCKFCDRIAVFSKDTIAEYGTHDELLRITDGIYAQMFTAQATYYEN